MEPLVIPEGQNTPAIHFDPESGKLEIIGNSIPEDVAGFYQRVFEWLSQYIEKPAPNNELHIYLNYFNSASAKAILDILNYLEALVDRNVNIQVFWHYQDLDEDMFSTGKEFQSLVNLPFQFVQHVSE
ncbi:MAG: DUF1987 domain-containing protein [Bacteroidales bacterium]|nr:DUF1987 domain-containing protein [Bacteroidales bacterium]